MKLGEICTSSQRVLTESSSSNPRFYIYGFVAFHASDAVPGDIQPLVLH